MPIYRVSVVNNANNPVGNFHVEHRRGCRPGCTIAPDSHDTDGDGVTDGINVNDPDPATWANHRISWNAQLGFLGGSRGPAGMDAGGRVLVNITLTLAPVPAPVVPVSIPVPAPAPAPAPEPEPEPAPVPVPAPAPAPVPAGGGGEGADTDIGASTGELVAHLCGSDCITKDSPCARHVLKGDYCYQHRGVA